ncbi:hypothetical protein G6F35_016066 [Rhizopus arrhizus]|nr:hypothetical protein G6F35_016066 [Rhizopus arrhizus]
MPIDDASMATALAPASRMAASVRCTVRTSGVVRSPPSVRPSGSTAPRVPMVPQGLSLRLSACAIHCTDEVLPLVPVTATTANAADGRPYQVSASSPSKARRPVTGNMGVSAAAARTESLAGASNNTALAPSANALSI